MNPSAVRGLLNSLYAVPQFIPEYWNVVEPIDIPYSKKNQTKLVSVLSPSPSKALRTLVFFTRTADPKFLMSVDLRLWPYQGTTAHNNVSFEELAGGEEEAAQFLTNLVLPNYPDYVSIPDWTKDTRRYKLLNRPLSGGQFKQFLATKRKDALPFGPYGCLGNIHWFNYFGSIYVDFIGRKRLIGAGWAHVEEIGQGLACYSTRKIDDLNGPTKRQAIAEALKEFVWSPSCKPEEKRIPSFDFSEQFKSIPFDVANKLNPTHKSNVISLAGLSRDEIDKALDAMDQKIQAPND